ncbi:MAG: hypothetical protein ACQKBT_03100, partial [Puniceicoccales bacterium]
EFETLTFSWDDSGALNISSDSLGSLLNTNDTTYSSFSRIYISGNANGYFDNLEVSSTIPEFSSSALITGTFVSFLTLVGLRRKWN